MKEQTERTDASEEHLAKCRSKLAVLMEQKTDMQLAFDELIEDIGSGARRFKVYRQMKMYNDESLNPVLYAQKK
jgi:ribosome-associated translation inhibitor RaiA